VWVADELVFDWDEANVAHVARHNVTPEEVEQVFTNDPMDLGVEAADGEERYASVGHTNRCAGSGLDNAGRRDPPNNGVRCE
jgi:uncharacterized DUF497 family protein